MVNMHWADVDSRFRGNDTLREMPNLVRHDTHSMEGKIPSQNVGAA